MLKEEISENLKLYVIILISTLINCIFLYFIQKEKQLWKELIKVVNRLHSAFGCLEKTKNLYNRKLL